MFEKARLKLTLNYLAIIMTISLAFSMAVYTGVNRELERIENFQRQRIIKILGGLPVPFEIAAPDSEAITMARVRIITVLGFINLSILFLSGVAGYYLAGQTLDPIKRSMDEQKEFVSSASHELRTPLTILKSEIEVALRDKKLTTKDSKDLIRSNLEEVNRMQKLTDYLLKLHKFEELDKISYSKVDLKIIADEATEKIKKLAEVKKIKIIKNLKNTSVLGNKEALMEVALILLDNAIKYTPEGKNIYVETVNKILTIRDEGIGISRDDLGHIFERFYRVDKSRKKDGYGLGLSIARTIIDLHKGTITVESKLQKGSTFKVIFS